MQSKSIVRKNILTKLKRLRALTGFEFQNLSINLRLQNELKARRGIWAAFMPLLNEPNLVASYQGLASQIDFVFPRVYGDEIQFFLSSPDSSFERNSFGILEPRLDSSQRILASEITGVLVPGLAFDQRGSRLGRGRGFYDRFLKKCTAEKIGICFRLQFLNEALNTQSHDQKMDRLITENFTLNFSAVKETAMNIAESFDLLGTPERNYL